MTDRPDVSPWRKLIGITILSSLIVPQASVLSQDIDPATAVAADPLRLAAEDTASCRELRDPDVRLACFDAAAHRLSEALGSRYQVVRNAGGLPISTAATNASAAPATLEPLVRATKQLPDWAAAPQRQRQRRDDDKAETPRRFEATIVRITSNNVGRHRFYTEDGAVWEQTQLVEVIQPKSLPTVAKFRRSLTGNPTISFEVSSRSYRVRRIE